MKISISLLITVLMFFQSLNGQNTDIYYKYDFQTYLTTKTITPEEYLEKIQETVKYPAIARENQVEGKLEFLLLNHGDHQSEIILKKHGLTSEKENFNDVYLPYIIFEYEVKRAFKEVDKELLASNEEKFMTAFSILFEMESSDTFSEKDREEVNFVIQGRKVGTSRAIKMH